MFEHDLVPHGGHGAAGVLDALAESGVVLRALGGASWKFKIAGGAAGVGALPARCQRCVRPGAAAAPHHHHHHHHHAAAPAASSHAGAGLAATLERGPEGSGTALLRGSAAHAATAADLVSRAGAAYAVLARHQVPEASQEGFVNAAWWRTREARRGGAYRCCGWVHPLDAAAHSFAADDRCVRGAG